MKINQELKSTPASKLEDKTPLHKIVEYASSSREILNYLNQLKLLDKNLAVEMAKTISADGSTPLDLLKKSPATKEAHDELLSLMAQSNLPPLAEPINLSHIENFVNLSSEEQFYCKAAVEAANYSRQLLKSHSHPEINKLSSETAQELTEKLVKLRKRYSFYGRLVSTEYLIKEMQVSLNGITFFVEPSPETTTEQVSFITEDRVGSCQEFVMTTSQYLNTHYPQVNHKKMSIQEGDHCILEFNLPNRTFYLDAWAGEIIFHAEKLKTFRRIEVKNENGTKRYMNCVLSFNPNFHSLVTKGLYHLDFSMPEFSLVKKISEALSDKKQVFYGLGIIRITNSIFRQHKSLSDNSASQATEEKKSTEHSFQLFPEDENKTSFFGRCVIL